MIKDNNVLTNGQEIKIKELEAKMKYGDYESLASLLNCSRDAARKRFKRGNQEAITALQKIIDSRELLLNNVTNE